MEGQIILGRYLAELKNDEEDRQASTKKSELLLYREAVGKASSKA